MFLYIRCWVAFCCCVCSVKAQNSSDSFALVRNSHITTNFYYTKSILPKQTVYTQPYPNFFWGIAIPDSVGDKAYYVRGKYNEEGALEGTELYQRNEKGDAQVTDFVDCCPFPDYYTRANGTDYYSLWIHPTGLYRAGFVDATHPDYIEYTASPEDIKATKEDSARVSMVLRKQNFKGNLIWEATVGSILTNPHFFSIEKFDMRCNEKGDVFILKSVETERKKSRLYLSKIDGKSGKFIFSNRPMRNKGASIVYLMPDNKDGCYLLLKNPASDNFIVQKYNSKGGLLWENVPFAPSAGDRSFYDIVFLFDNNANLLLVQETDGSKLLPSANQQKAAPLEIVAIAPNGKTISHKSYGTFFNRQPFLKESLVNTYPSRELQILNVLQDPNDGYIYLRLACHDYPRTDLVKGKLIEGFDKSYDFVELVFSPKGELIEAYFTY